MSQCWLDIALSLLIVSGVPQLQKILYTESFPCTCFISQTSCRPQWPAGSSVLVSKLLWRVTSKAPGLHCWFSWDVSCRNSRHKIHCRIPCERSGIISGLYFQEEVLVSVAVRKKHIYTSLKITCSLNILPLKIPILQSCFLSSYYEIPWSVNEVGCKQICRQFSRLG